MRILKGVFGVLWSVAPALYTSLVFVVVVLVFSVLNRVHQDAWIAYECMED